MAPSIRRFVALALLITAGQAVRAEASYTFNISGTFGNDIGTVATGLAGGSFSGTYTIDNFGGPQNINVDSDQINLYNAAGQLTYVFSSPAITANDGGYYQQMVGGGSLDALVFYHKVNDIRTDELNLAFASPFTGVGSAMSYSRTPFIRSQLIIGNDGYALNSLVAVASAVSSVPAPPSLILIGMSGLIGVGRMGWRRLALGRRG